MSLDPQAPVSSLGEDGLVELLRSRFDPGSDVIGIGDDAAVFPSPASRLVMTTDTLVEDVDFRLAYVSGEDLGWKAMAANVSDLAAMGAEPAYATATLCLPSQTTVGFVTGVITGMADAAGRWGLAVVGGDLSSADRISVGVTLLGHAEDPFLRSGARAGDAIVVSGALGGSAAGLHLLRADPASIGPLVQRHVRPQARLELSRALRKVPITSMIDVSDGLVVDLRRVMAASGTGCGIDPERVPLDPAMAAVRDLDPLQAALFGGEDFELLFTVAEDDLSAVMAAGERLDLSVTLIGHVTEDGCFLGETAFDDLEGQAWDHLRSR